MPSIEKVVYEVLKCDVEQVGVLCQHYVGVSRAISTRPFLNHDRMEGRMRRASREYPEVISVRKLDFIIDGHHKFRRAHDHGDSSLYSTVLFTDNELLAIYLYKISHGHVGDLEIK